MLQIDQRIEHGLQVTETDFPIEPLRERLQVDIGRIHRPVEFCARLRADFACSDSDRFDSHFPASLRHVNRVLHKDHRVVVREGDTAATQCVRCLGNGRRRGRIRQRVGFTRLADIPVLAELAAQIATGRAERKHRSSGKKMIQRLLLDGVDAVAARTSVRCEDDLIVFAGAHEAKPALAFVQFAEARADIALNSPVVERMPIFRRDCGRGAGSHDLPLCCPN